MADDNSQVSESLSSISSSLSSLPAEYDLDAAESEAKDRLSRYVPRSRSDDTQRVLTSFIEHLPARGRMTVSKFIAESRLDDQLFKLAEHFFTAIFIPICATGGKTPAVTPSPLEDAEPELEAAVTTMLHNRKDQGQLRKRCLKRDNYRCMITGFYDGSATNVIPAEQIGLHQLNTDLAHIIPFSIGKYDKNNEQITRTWVTLYALFPELREKENFTADDINSPRNAMSLVKALHEDFGKLNLALEPTDEENTYLIRTYHGFQTAMCRDMPPPNSNNERIVTFEKHSDCDLPSPVLLSIHAAIARVLHASGKAKSIDEFLWDRSELRCLAPDGSTSNLTLLLAFYER